MAKTMYGFDDSSHNRKLVTNLRLILTSFKEAFEKSFGDYIARDNSHPLIIGPQVCQNTCVKTTSKSPSTTALLKGNQLLKLGT